MNNMNNMNNINNMNNMNDMNNKIYIEVYNEIINDEDYDKKYFSNYDEFIIFCNKDFSQYKELTLLVHMPEIKFANKIANMIIQKTFSADKNKQITYFKYTNRRHTNN